MGCGCNKGKKAPAPAPAPSGGPHTLTASGTTQEYGSRLEAEAAKIRIGGGQVRPK